MKLSDAGAKPVDLGVLPDGVRDTLAAAALSYDVLIVSGGASQGTGTTWLNHRTIGKRHRWENSSQAPRSFGQIGDCVVPHEPSFGSSMAIGISRGIPIAEEHSANSAAETHRVSAGEG